MRRAEGKRERRGGGEKKPGPAETPTMAIKTTINNKKDFMFVVRLNKQKVEC